MEETLASKMAADSENLRTGLQALPESLLVAPCPSKRRPEKPVFSVTVETYFFLLHKDISPSLVLQLHTQAGCRPDSAGFCQDEEGPVFPAYTVQLAFRWP